MAGRSNAIVSCENFGSTTSRPCRVSMNIPDAQVATILAVPAVEASVALERMASRISCVPSSTSLAIPAVVPMLASIQALPGRSPLMRPSGSIFICDRGSSRTPATEALMAFATPQGSVRVVNSSWRAPARLNMRGGTLRMILAPNNVPSGSTILLSNHTGSTRRA